MDKTTDYIFSINTGRSGSDYRCEIFRHVSGCRFFYEPKPKCNGAVMRQFAQGQSGPMKSIAEKKIQAIKESNKDSLVYFESNQCFVKGFGWFFPRYIPEDRIGVVILKREKSKIAKSFARIGCSPLVPWGRDWITTPDIKDPLVTPPGKIRAAYGYARGAKFMWRAARLLGRKLFH